MTDINDGKSEQETFNSILREGSCLCVHAQVWLLTSFAYASDRCTGGIQEMLIQSHTGIIRIFPAIPASWKDASFEKLRTYGAFLISARKENGIIKEISVTSEKGGLLRMANPFTEADFSVKGTHLKPGRENGLIELEMEKGQTVTFSI